MQRVGVFVCWCGSNIAGTVDVEAVSEALKSEPGVVFSTNYQYMCSQAGQDMIKEAVKEHNLTGIVVCSCSPRMHEATFRKTAEKAGLNPYMVEIANIREQCSWVMKDVGDEQTKQNREGLFKGAGGTALELLYPRMSESVKRGEDIDVGDVFGDATEQFLYSINPIGRGLGGAINASKLGSNAIGKGLKYLDSNATNPFAMETLDAMTYEGKDIPRAKFNEADVLLGTGINAGMNRLADRIILRKLSDKAKNNLSGFIIMVH